MVPVDILGNHYTIVVKRYDEDPDFEKRGIAAYCDNRSCTIVLCDMRTYKGYEDETPESVIVEQNRLLRHEIVHAFLYQSGLSVNSLGVDEWATNEEMVDWIALQGPKIYRAWMDVNAL
nr:hypothetical protein [uncultured Dysosmobacter sp.]